MTRTELNTIEAEVDRINSEMDWRCPNKEWQWYEWADTRLGFLIEVLEESHKLTRIRELGLRLINGGAA